MDQNRRLVLCAFLITNLCALTTSLNLPLEENPVEPPLKIAAFNAQNLGDKKLSKIEEMEVIKRIILRYDVICIQEIVTQDQERLEEMITSLNLKTPNDVIYRMALSERLGRGTAKEQYAYIYRDDKLSVLDEQAFPDVEDLFMRPPYIVHFSSPTTRDLSSFVAICSHTQPSGAANETHALATVYDYAQNHYKNPNAIIMGDFNAGCSNVRVGDWNWIALWTREEFTWLIGHHIDTTTYVSSCPYDRFVIAGSKMESAVIPGSPKPFDFQEEYSLTDDQTKDVSDHLPIELQLRGKMSDVAEQYLKSKTCFTVEDERQVSNVLVLYQERENLPISVKLLTDNNNVVYVKAYSKSSNINNIINNLNLLSTTFQDIVSEETFQAVKYKVLYGGLNDVSSFVMVEEPLYTFQVECNSYYSVCSTTVCKDTNIN